MLTSFIALSSIVILALLIVQLGANALTLTGMSQSVARFQACSAFFGVGFTTTEAELVVNHPIRRKIILHLIIAGNIGITSALAALVVTVMSTDHSSRFSEIVTLGLVVGLTIAVGLLLNIPWIKGPMDAVMKKTLRRVGLVKVVNYDVLLHVENGYGVADIELDVDHPITGKTLAQARPADRGVVVLAIRRKNGDFLGAPASDQCLEAGDTLMIYGSDEDVAQMRKGHAVAEDFAP